MFWRHTFFDDVFTFGHALFLIFWSSFFQNFIWGQQILSKYNRFVTVYKYYTETVLHICTIRRPFSLQKIFDVHISLFRQAPLHVFITNYSMKLKFSIFSPNSKLSTSWYPKNCPFFTSCCCLWGLEWSLQCQSLFQNKVTTCHLNWWKFIQWSNKVEMNSIV